MRASARRHWKPIVLVIEVVLMACIYQAIWMGRPDFFRVEADLNVLPLDLFQKAWGFDERKGVLPRQVNPDLQAAAKQVQSVYDQMQTATVQLDADKRELAARQKVDAIGQKAFEDSTVAQMEAYVAQKAGVFEPQIAAAQRQMSILEVAAGATSPEAMPAGDLAIRHSKLAVEVARLRLAQAQANSDARDYTLHNMTLFQKRPEQIAFVAQYRRTEALQKKVLHEMTELTNDNGKIYEAFDSYVTAAQAKLTFWDFLYFSIGGATTATFGDISPNHTVVRMLFSAQIIFSIVLVSLWLNDLTRERRSPVSAGN
jgi:hypothetical protein